MGECKDLAYLFKGAIGGGDHRAVFITFGNDLVEILSGPGRNGRESEIVQNEQITRQVRSELSDWKPLARAVCRSFNRRLRRPGRVKQGILAADRKIYRRRC